MSKEELNEKIALLAEQQGNQSSAALAGLLKDVISYVDGQVSEAEKPKYVELFINSTQPTANFIWPFEDTEISNVEVIGYIGNNFSDGNKILRAGIRFAGTVGYAQFNEYGDYQYWSGSLQKLEKGKFYTFEGADLGDTNAHVYIRPLQQ